MVRRKRQRTKSSPAHRKLKKQKQARNQLSSNLERSVLHYLAEQNKPVSFANILNGMFLTRKEKATLVKVMDELVHEKKVMKKNKRYFLPASGEVLLATLEVNRKGFGFATEENQPHHKKDIFIAARDLNGASHGDTIQVQLTRTAKGRREGKVLKVVQRAFTSLYGIFSESGKGGFVTPDNDRIPYTVTIGKQDTNQAPDGHVVKVEIIDYGSDSHDPTGKITELLGDPYDAQVQIRLATAQYSLREVFPDSVLEEAETFSPLTSCEDTRKDLRDIQHVTIDGKDARDFDDAVCVEKNDNGYTLYVSIADVSHYVKSGSAVDKEAYQRGTSVYLPDRVLPMLPEKLSNNLCSLVPDKPRPAFTAILTFDRGGRRTHQSYTKSLIKSCQRFTYSTVNEILYMENKDLQQEFSNLFEMLSNSKELARLLNKQRIARGSLGFNIPEPTMKVDEGTVEAISLSERNQAHMLIEEFMLAANEAVAETLSSQNIPALYRIHEDPDTAKLENFTDVCKMLSVDLPRGERNPSWFAKILSATNGTQVEYVINNLLLRSMQQARYSPENNGHFGLAAEHYLHFTSPIRRYPDLIAHRALQGHLVNNKQTVLFPDQPAQSLAEAGKKLSQCERRAIEVTRSIHSRLAVLFMRDKIGETFRAIISGVTSFGLFVELKEYYISGGVPVKEMADDYYLHDAKRHRLIGERSNKIYQLGDEIDVSLEHADLLGKKLTFTIV